MNFQGTWKWTVYSFCAVLTILVVVLSWQKKELTFEKQRLQAEEYYPKKTEWIPEQTFTAMDGRPVRIGQGTSGRQIVLHFSTKCPYCQSSAKFIAELSRAAKRQGIEMVAFTPETNRSDVERFMATNGMDFPVVSVPERKTLGALRFRMSPTLLVLSPQGQIEYTHVGKIVSDMEGVGVLQASMRKDSLQAKL